MSKEMEEWRAQLPTALQDSTEAPEIVPLPMVYQLQ
jgi:hypothetical protein